MRTRRLIVPMLVMSLAAGGGAALAGCDDDDAPSGTTTSDPDLPITVQQLIERSADTPIATQGLLYVVNDVARLCGAILESYPPQCGEPSVELVGLDLAAVDGVTADEGVAWKEGAVLTLQWSAESRYAVIDTGTDVSP